MNTNAPNFQDRGSKTQEFIFVPPDSTLPPWNDDVIGRVVEEMEALFVENQKEVFARLFMLMNH